MNKVYANIKAIRLKKGLTQEDVAEQLGLAPSNYGRVERGLTEITIDRLEKLSEIFEMSVNAILKYDQDNPIDYKEDVDYYYNLTQKQQAKIEKLKEQLEESQEDGEDAWDRKNDEILKLKEGIKVLKSDSKKLVEDYELKLSHKEEVLTLKDEQIKLLTQSMNILQNSLNPKSDPVK
jgi:transcriptional regulator with XRE-family HTH domain